MRRDDLIRQLEARLARWDEQLDGLRARIDRVEPQHRAAYRAEIQRLEQARHEAERHLGDLRSGEPDSWVDEDFRAALLRIFDDFGTRLDRLISGR